MIKAAEEEKWVEDKEEEGGEYRNRSQNQFQILTHQHSGCSSLLIYSFIISVSDESVER